MIVEHYVSEGNIFQQTGFVDFFFPMLDLFCLALMSVDMSLFDDLLVCIRVCVCVVCCLPFFCQAHGAAC